MKMTQTVSRFMQCLAIGLAMTQAPTVKATPYASGITNAGGTIKFFLNESNVTSIYVLFDNNTVSNNLATLGQTNVGVNSFSLGTHSNYSIFVFKVGSGIPSQISPAPAANTNLSFFGPRGVSVNTNPKQSYFGRIYVANASPNSTVSGINTRASYKGLYAVNPDFSDALGQATNPSPAKVNFPNGGANWWGSSTTFSPFKLYVGKDDKLYVGDASASGVTAGCPLWMIDPNLTTPIQVFQYSGILNGCGTNAGPISSTPVITGSLATGDLTLTCMMYNYATNPFAISGADFRSVMRYNIGSGPIDSAHTWTGSPVIIATNTQPGFGGFPGINAVAEDISVGPNGYVYVSYPRASTNGIAGANNDVWIYDNQVPANLLWASAGPGAGLLNPDGTTNDIFVANGIFTYGVTVTKDTNYIVFGNNGAANVAVVNLTNGIPDISTLKKITAPNSGQRAVAVDAADNIYTVDGNSDSLRVYSLGLTTTCITRNDSTGTNGTFQMIIPNTSVSVTAVTNVASQTGPTPGLFTLTRSGQNLNLPLTVSFKFSGTASNGVYTVSPAGLTPATNNTITFAANFLTTNITIIPVVDSVPRLTTTVTLTLAGGSSYAVGSPASDTVSILNTVTPAISVTNLDAQMYERTNDFARFKISRLGDTNVDLTGAINITFGGTAQFGQNFYGSTVVDMPPGMTTTNIKVFPIHDGLVTGPLTITATAASGVGYNVATPAATGTVTIVDSDLPPETVLWSDSLSVDSSANWTQLFASTNGDSPYDATVTWALDYSSLAVPSAPHSTDGNTLGLYMTVNKNDAIPAAAALNLYPTGKSFSGNYALRFDMFLIENDTTGTTEYALFGINHSGTQTNWFRNSSGGVPSGWNFDGIFYDVESDGAALGDYVGYSAPNAGTGPTPISAGRNASTLTGIFKSPPWTPGAASGGAAANLYGSSTPIWADVEISQINNVITWKINQTVIFSYTNTTAYTSGNIMLGYEDAYDSIGSSGGSVVYANARVISLAGPLITQITNSSSSVNIKFSANAADVATQFVLQSASVVSGPYNDVGSIITALGSGNFNATLPLNGPVQFYRIRRIY